jgi:recombinational DNA repair protein RecR
VFAARSVTQLIEELMRLPGVGEKTAQRLAFHLLKVPKQEAEALALSILAVKEISIAARSAMASPRRSRASSVAIPSAIACC